MSNAEITARKQRGIPFRPGQSGNPAGRPKGARNRLSTDFLLDLHQAWQEHGRDALAMCAEQKPDAFCRIVADLLPKDVRLDVDVAVNPAGFLTTFRSAVAALHADAPRVIENDRR